MTPEQQEKVRAEAKTAHEASIFSRSISHLGIYERGYLARATQDAAEIERLKLQVFVAKQIELERMQEYALQAARISELELLHSGAVNKLDEYADHITELEAQIKAMQSVSDGEYARGWNHRSESLSDVSPTAQKPEPDCSHSGLE